MHRTSVVLSVFCLAGLVGCQLPQKQPSGTFYPIGIYAVGNTKDFKTVREAGFNVVVGQADSAYLDAAEAAGLKVLASPGTTAGMSFDPEAADHTVRQFDRHPALWAWYLVDEPDFNEVPPEAVLEAHRQVKTAGARKPTALVLFQGYQALYYGNIADITMVDRYPVPWLPLASFGQHMAQGRLALGTKKPLVAVIQAFDWNACPHLLPGETNLRPPTYEEMRCMTYEALARGANGLFYYAFDAGKWRMREQPETWHALQTIVQEVNRRRPLFEAAPQWWPKRHRFGDRDLRFNAALESSITSVLLRVSRGNALIPDGDYILAVNNTDQRQEYSFALPVPGRQKTIPVLDENRSLTPDHDRVADSFSPYAVHVYGPL